MTPEHPKVPTWTVSSNQSYFLRGTNRHVSAVPCQYELLKYLNQKLIDLSEHALSWLWHVSRKLRIIHCCKYRSGPCGTGICTGTAIPTISYFSWITQGGTNFHALPFWTGQLHSSPPPHIPPAALALGKHSCVHWALKLVWTQENKDWLLVMGFYDWRRTTYKSTHMLRGATAASSVSYEKNNSRLQVVWGGEQVLLYLLKY